jgi:hypothetical protein
LAFFSDANLESVGIKPKMRLCDKCGRSMIFTPGEGFCCPAGHGCEWPKEEREPPTKAIACQGDTIKKGSSSKGRKRKKKPKKQQWTGIYGDS